MRIEFWSTARSPRRRRAWSPRLTRSWSPARRRRYVSRGGDKLAAALDQFHLDVTGVDALDAGASTGGFTDCLLQRGARSVVALDVGHGQLHPKIRGDPRVVVIERVNVRNLTIDMLTTVPGLVVADLSFISLTKVIGVLTRVVVPGGDLVLLVKPQFEAGRREVDRARGVIIDPAGARPCARRGRRCVAAERCTVHGWCDSPITGGDGNREFLVHATSDGAAR